ncbi:hypothetical protein L0V05_06005 [Tabrizicola sp. J26]|uniref:hypothetical protein n=1 Tax=Alitabrizicola rongguiensis TaxID=2909234 RepID=UPI001F230742|nr:hypothetical protein [Tabrizicola rongguiensis]MCF1708371.1 hypothetical protein [Tabrizicola rongguiensis]
MPFRLFAAILAAVIAAAGLTILVAQMVNLPLAILSLVAIAAALGLRMRLRA